MNARIAKWDNLKCFLIFNVVIGHLANQFVSQSALMRSISLFIYSYHMPLFIFVAGLMQKKWTDKHPFDWSKPLFFILLGYLLKFLIWFVKFVFGKNPDFQWFGDTGIPWYMFAMAAFMVMAYLLRRVSPFIVLPVSIAAACLAGYCDQINSFLYLSRILVFFPFYELGYLLTSEEVMDITSLPVVKAISVPILIGTAYLAFFRIRTVYSYIRLFTGRNPYSTIHVDGCGWQHRLLFYGLSLLVGIAVIGLTPNVRIAFAQIIGQRTLQIYFWHRLVIYAIIYLDLPALVHTILPLVWCQHLLIVGGCALTICLSLRLFGVPLNKLRKREQLFTASFFRTLSPVYASPTRVKSGKMLFK